MRHAPAPSAPPDLNHPDPCPRQRRKPQRQPADPGAGKTHAGRSTEDPTSTTAQASAHPTTRQVAAPGVPHVQPATTRHTNTPPKQQPTTTDTHPNRAGGKDALGKDAPPNLDTARARIRQVSAIISDLSRQADAVSRIIGLPRPPNEQ